MLNKLIKELQEKEILVFYIKKRKKLVNIKEFISKNSSVNTLNGLKIWYNFENIIKFYDKCKKNINFALLEQNNKREDFKIISRSIVMNKRLIIKVGLVRYWLIRTIRIKIYNDEHICKIYRYRNYEWDWR